ncbi:MAG: CoA ester lyase [Acidimicrobiaceae bacterium]|jgi:citrate lyase subunit beta/citryl-CoA lyase|nr:CoA ester lyase [Acidimicrobiaceae bacterium]|tara:strand:+ start:45235 stop:46068 length:834 start_codon:yes stop_codon:yes gene_type:complete
MTEKMRSMLFAPGNKLDLLKKISRVQPDVAVIDFEDAVPNSEKVVARANLIKYTQDAINLDLTIFVRVNPTLSEYFENDLQSLPPQVTGIIIPKVSNAEDVEKAEEAFERNSVNAKMLVGIETVNGLVALNDIFAKESVVGAYFGAEDYIHDLGGVRTQGNNEVLYARSQMGISSRIFGVPVIDQIVADFSDNERFIREAQEAKSLGFAGKLCIHPSQVPLSNQSFSPTTEEIVKAIELLKVYDRAVEEGTASVVFEGQMVDEALAKQARSILDLKE